MIKIMDVMKSLAGELRRIVPEFDVITVDDLEVTSDKSISLELIRPSVRSKNLYTVDVDLVIDVVFFIKKVKTSQLYDLADEITENLTSTLKVLDRYITLSKANNINIVDDILHYEIRVSYSDWNDKKYNEKHQDEVVLEKIEIGGI